MPTDRSCKGFRLDSIGFEPTPRSQHATDAERSRKPHHRDLLADVEAAQLRVMKEDVLSGRGLLWKRARGVHIRH